MNDNQNLFSLSIDPVTKSYLTDIYKWTKFLAITGMVVLFLGLVAVALGATVSPTLINAQSDGSVVTEVAPATKATLAIVSVICVAIAFFPLYFLLQFSNKMKKALVSNNQEELNESFAKLKTYFKYLGIIIIIAFVIYVLVIVLYALGMAASS
ncbi:MAG: DUF5362 family protein [Flavisolibacter sp.]|jgi:hypothetical protein